MGILGHENFPSPFCSILRHSYGEINHGSKWFWNSWLYVGFISLYNLYSACSYSLPMSMLSVISYVNVFRFVFVPGYEGIFQCISCVSSARIDEYICE